MLDPRFPGGTGAAVAAEIAALAPHADLALHALDTAMLAGRPVNPALQAALDRAGLAPIRDAAVIRADVVILHNPACLKFEAALGPRISARAVYVVTHENPVRPGGGAAFDMGACLGLIEAALVCGRRALAPVSPWNRRCVARWLEAEGCTWPLAPVDWFNIFDLEMTPPTATPRDRRGRHSRPGLEKFPAPQMMAAHFPAHAEHCAILGADALMADTERLPRHWRLIRFGEMEVARFLEGIDFFVYFTNPAWRESFGRVIAEAIAAGKVVITDPGTAEVFGDAVIASDGDDVDTIIAGFVADPERYGAFVRAAQATLARFRPEAFVATLLPEVLRTGSADVSL